MTFTDLPDLASRALGGSVVAANDELFAPKENLILPEPPALLTEFGHQGKLYDGWETRRRREPGADWAVVRLGEPGVIRGVVVDTAHFTGNYPPEVSVQATAIDPVAEGYPAAGELADRAWTSLVPVSAARGDTANAYPVDDDRVWTHVRLTIHPDGGVARFRVHGEPRPDPRFATDGLVDLAAREHGGTLLDCSDQFYGSAGRLLEPGRARHMGEGWENARRRGGGNDWALFRLGVRGVVAHVELDTSYFLGNAPGAFRLTACDGDPASAAWTDLVPRTDARPDTRHRYLVDHDGPVDHVRLDVYPDGGLARLRLWGRPAEG